ncbi:MAG: hypothetical protein AAGB12_00450 [Pseudomonadota bacterium]
MLTLFFSNTVCTDPVQAKQLYRFKDKDGRAVIRDFLPPHQAQAGYEVLNESFQVIKTVPPAKTPEELAEEARKIDEARLKKEQEVQRQEEQKQQQINDQMMMLHYSSYQDILRNRQSDLGAVDVLINVNINTIKKYEKELANYQSQAARLERQGKEVSNSLNDKIKKTQTKIIDLEKDNQGKALKKQVIVKDYVKRLIRFKRLRAYQLIKLAEDDKLTLKYPNARIRSCRVNDSCEAFWSKATDFVKAENKLDYEVENQNLLLTQYPKADDFTISLTQVADNSEPGTSWVIFELFCASSVTGTRMCQSKPVKELVKRYENIQ